MERLPTVVEAVADNEEFVPIAAALPELLSGTPPPSIVMGIINSRGDLRIIAGSRFAPGVATGSGTDLMRFSIVASACCTGDVGGKGLVTDS